MAGFQSLAPSVRLSVVNPEAESNSVFGRGIASLCKGVRDTGSLNAAAKSMGMAYSKAWRIIKSTEETLGVPLLDRDGARGSSLTPEGNALLDLYLNLQDSLDDQVCKLFEEARKSAIKTLTSK